MAVYNAEGIVIRSRDFDEADKILVLLTREEGKVQAVARGARRPRSRYAAAGQLFTQANLALYKGRQLDTLSQIDIVESFRHLREDLVRMAYATYVCELMDEMVKERQRVEQAYLLLLTTLHLLNAPEYQPEPVLRAYELKLLSILGFRPEFSRCISCGKEIAAGPWVRFAPAAGGVLCGECPAEGEQVLRLSRGALETMRHLLEGDIRRVHVIKIGPELAKELDLAIGSYISARLERRLKSREFLNTLRF